jgi:hypothetical protein
VRALRAPSAWWTALAVLLLTTVTFAQRQPHPEAASSELPPLAQARISAGVGEDQQGYHASTQSGGFRMENVTHALSAAFTPSGVDFQQGPHRWGMALRAYGYEGALRQAHLTAPTAKANRVEYHRGALTEWYLNGPVGLEQGFTLDRAPGTPNGQPLTLAFTLSGDLSASVDPGGRSVTLRKGAAAALSYGGLIAVDADSRELPAWLDTTGDQLRIRVDDSDARYPIIIDPFVQAAKLTSVKLCDPTGVCDDGAQGDQLGFALSISADGSTVVVTAPFKYATSFARGVAYVFLKPSDFEGGWSSWPRYKAKLVASDGNTNGLFLGYSADISRDGGTIVVGAPAFVPPGGQVGAAYVFVRPPNGWDTVAQHVQVAKLTPAPPSGTSYRGSFGLDVAISGDGATIAVGESDHRLNGVYTGAAYTFLKPATGWVNAVESQKFIGSGIDESYYGSSVALSDDGRVMIVGATGEDPAGGERNDQGTAYVLTRRSNPGAPDSYSSVARLVASDGIPYEVFGNAVSADADGSTIVVGAPGDDSDSVPHYGGLYVFRRPAGGWAGNSITQTAKLTASDASTAIGSIGMAADISVDGNTILATSYPRVGQTAPPAAYFFARPPTGWATATEDTTMGWWDVLPADAFGQSAALSGDGRVAVVGAPLQMIDASIFRGAAYVFTGTAATPRAAVSPAGLTFGPQEIGTTSSPQTVTLTNTGSAPLHVSSVGLIGPYTMTHNCLTASPIPPGGSCSASVRFAPVSMGSAPWGTLTFTDNSGGTNGAIQQVALYGEPRAASTVTTISLPAQVLVGQVVEVFYSVLPAAGGTVMPFGQVSVQASTGEGCGGGGHSDDGSCFLVFTNPITRTVTATYTGNNNFESSTSAPATIRVTDFTLSAPASQSVSGKKATFTLTVGAVNGFTGPVALTCTGGPANSTCAVAATITVSGASATTKATVTVATGTPSGSYTMTFTASSGGLMRSTTATLVVK